jgi:[ribosomal protein S5]-alanine N-acetyltransferase
MTAAPSAELLPLPVLQGERCLLRAYVAADAPAMRAQADNAKVSANLFEGFPSPYLQEHAEAWCGHEANSGRFGYVWAVTVDGRVAGTVGLRPLDKPGDRCNAEIGYWLGESFWRRGIASDAVRQVTDWAFAALPHLTRLYAPIYARNEGSQAVARKCGYVREGVHRQAIIKQGQVLDLTTWAAYRTEVARRNADIGAALAATAADAMERT